MAITNGTNVTALEKPAVGIDAGPGWATAINNSIDAVDDHDHSSNKGVRITPAGVNINADLDYNSNSATELKNVIFNSTVTAATTAYSLYQASGNLFFRDGSGTAIQMTITGTVNAGAGSIAGMSGTQAGASYADGSKTFNFFTDSGNEDYGKMAHADLILYKFSDDNTGDTDYVTIAANAAVSGSSGTIYVPSENGTFLTTATSYATAAINIATSASNYPINLKPHGSGRVVIGNAGVRGEVTSNGAYDLVLSTNSGVDSGSIVIEDAVNGDINFMPNGTGKILVGSGSAAGVVTSSGAHDITVSTNSGTNSSYINIVDAANGNINLVNNGNGEVVIGSGAASGKITSSGAYDLVLDTNAGTNTGTLTLERGVNGNIDLTPNGTGEVNLSKVDIDAGAIDGTAIGASSHTTGKFTTCDATTDFTIGGTVITNNTITDDGTLAINSTTETVFNSLSADVDFRIENAGQPNAFFVDGAASGGTVRMYVGSATGAGLTSGQMSQLQFNNYTADNTGGISINQWSGANQQRGTVNFAKSLGTTFGSYTILTTGRPMGAICWYGADGTDFANQAAEIEVVANTVGSNNIGGDMLFKTSAGGGAVPTTRMTIDEDGNIESSTTGKIKQKGAFMQSSTHQVLTLGY
jgi:hypothetical protein